MSIEDSAEELSIPNILQETLSGIDSVIQNYYKDYPAAFGVPEELTQQKVGSLRWQQGIKELMEGLQPATQERSLAARQLAEAMQDPIFAAVAVRFAALDREIFEDIRHGRKRQTKSQHRRRYKRMLKTLGLKNSLLEGLPDYD
jgi:hypothetical protein